MILILSHLGIPHAVRVMAELQAAGNEALLLDLADLPDRASLTIDYADPQHPTLVYERRGEPPSDLGRVTAVWWRRPQAAEPASVHDQDVRLFTCNEWNEATQGLWQLLAGVRWMNPPLADDAAGRKALQLRVSAEVGLRVPRTLITSSAVQARRFIEAQGVGETVYKTFSCTHAVWRETRQLRPCDLGLLEAVQVAPVIFQEYIRAEADLRVTVVGDEMFPAAIEFPEADRPIDFRLNLGRARTQPASLPPEVAAKLRLLMRRLGLVHGAIDLRRTPEGEHVFLEVNTAGEFLFIEERTNQPITRAVASWLADARA